MIQLLIDETILNVQIVLYLTAYLCSQKHTISHNKIPLGQQPDMQNNKKKYS